MRKIVNKIKNYISKLECIYVPDPEYVDDKHKVCESCGGSGTSLTGSHDCDGCEGRGIISISYQEYVDNLPDHKNHK